MKDKMDQALISLIEKSVSAVEEGVTFLSQEIPDVARQLLMWEMVYSLIYFFFGMLLFILPLLAIKKWGGKGQLIGEGKYRETLTHDDEGMFDADLVGLVIMVTGVSWVVALFLIELDWLKIVIAPKIYLIEYVTQLIK